MASSTARSLEETPTWAVAVVCFVLVVISIIIEQILHHIGKYLAKKKKRALYEALEKIKAELMLLGFISLLLTITQSWISEICIPKSAADSWHPCNSEQQAAKKSKYPDKCQDKDNRKVALVSTDGIHQLHIFIFVLAVSHILYCIVTLVLGRLKMRKWKKWERETKTVEYQFQHDPERFRFARDTSFGRRHLNFWMETPVLIWIVCFFRQFFRSVPKVDYLTLRHGFIMAHLAPQSSNRFDFQKYIKRSLEEDFTVVVGITPIIWFVAVLFLLFNTHGWFSYLWLPFFPLIIILAVGTKLQVIITRMGLRIQDRGDVIKGIPIVKPTDDLFWFNSPGLILFLIHFVLFQNAFQVAFFAWSWYEFGLRSCFHQKLEDIIIRLSMGILIQLLCSYVTLPLYALVTQMGTTMKPTIFNDRVAAALRNWHHAARKQIKHNRASGSVTPASSRPQTPSHGMSPVHLLRNNYRSDNLDSLQTSPTKSFKEEHWESESPSMHHQSGGSASSSRHNKSRDQGEQVKDNVTEINVTEIAQKPRPPPIRTQHEIDIKVLANDPKPSSRDFSFAKR